MIFGEMIFFALFMMAQASMDIQAAQALRVMTVDKGQTPNYTVLVEEGEHYIRHRPVPDVEIVPVHLIIVMANAPDLFKGQLFAEGYPTLDEWTVDPKKVVADLVKNRLKVYEEEKAKKAVMDAVPAPVKPAPMVFSSNDLEAK